MRLEFWHKTIIIQPDIINYDKRNRLVHLVTNYLISNDFFNTMSNKTSIKRFGQKDTFQEKYFAHKKKAIYGKLVINWFMTFNHFFIR